MNQAEMLTLTEMLTLIFERPALYLGRESVERAVSFINGFGHCKGEADDCYLGFNGWVAKRFDVMRTDNWAGIILRIEPDRIASFELAKELWTEYRTEFDERVNNVEL